MRGFVDNADTTSADFLRGSPKARLQWRLERELADFEPSLLQDADR